MSNQQVTKRVTLDVEAESNVTPGLQDVKRDVRRSFDELDREVSSRLKKVGNAAADAGAKPPAPSLPPGPGRNPKGEKEGPGGVGDALNSLKKQFGEESALGNAGKLLKGAGAIAGVAVIADVLADVTGGVKDLAVEIAKGQKSASELAETFVGKLPIVSNVYETFTNIGLTVTGTAAELERAATKADALDAAGKSIRGAFEGAKAAVEALDKESASIRIAIDKQSLDALPPWLREAGAKRIDLEARLKTNAADLDKDLKARREQILADNAEDLKKVDALAKSGDTSGAARLRGSIDRALKAAEVQVREAAGKRDALLREQFERETGVAYDAGANGLAAKLERQTAEIRAALGEAAADVVGGEGGATNDNAAIFKARTDALREDAAIGDRAKQNELERVELVARFVARAKELQEIARNTSDPAAQQAAAAAWARLGEQQRAAMGELGRRQAEAAANDAAARRGLLLGVQVDALRTQADLGNRAAAAEAERLELAEKYLEQERTLNAELEKAKKTHADTAAIVAAIGTLKQRQAAEEAEQARRRRDAQIDERLSRGGALLRIEVDAMRTRAQLGERGLDLEAKRLEIQQKYAEQAADLDRQIRDTRDEDVRARAVALRASLAKRQADEVLAAVREAADEAASIQMPTAGGETADQIAIRERYERWNRSTADRFAADRVEAANAAGGRSPAADVRETSEAAGQAEAESKVGAEASARSMASVERLLRDLLKVAGEGVDALQNVRMVRTASLKNV